MKDHRDGSRRNFTPLSLLPFLDPHQCWITQLVNDSTHSFFHRGYRKYPKRKQLIKKVCLSKGIYESLWWGSGVRGMRYTSAVSSRESRNLASITARVSKKLEARTDPGWRLVHRSHFPRNPITLSQFLIIPFCFVFVFYYFVLGVSSSSQSRFWDRIEHKKSLNVSLVTIFLVFIRLRAVEQLVRVKSEN